MKLFLWFVVTLLAIVAAMLSQLSLFLQTHSRFENYSYAFKLSLSMVLMFLQWAFIIPYMRTGSLVMNPVQITLFAFVMIFIVQILNNILIFNVENTKEEFIAAFIMIAGSFISSFHLLG